MGGIINEDEEAGRGKKEDGFIRLATLLLVVIKSDVPGKGVGRDEAERERAGTSGDGAEDETTLGA